MKETINIFKKGRKERLYWILAEFKYGKMPKEDSIMVATVCSNAFKGVAPCCAACPGCECHNEIEKYADRILKLLK